MFLDTSFLKNDEIFLRLDKTADADETKKWLPAYYFTICTMDGIEVGNCDFRIGYNDNTYYGGNIGYAVNKEKRGNHYAQKACRLLFELAKKHRMDYLIITCSPENIASRKTCEYAGGTLKEIADLPPDNDMYLEGERKKCIYFFDLKHPAYLQEPNLPI